MSRTKGDLEEVKVVSGMDNQEIASALGSDTTGNEIDLSTQDFPDKAVVVVGASSDLSGGSDELQFDLEHKSSGGSYSDEGTTVTITDSDAAGIVTQKVDLEGVKQKFRFYLDASASTLAGNADVHIDIVLAGQDAIPA